MRTERLARGRIWVWFYCCALGRVTFNTTVLMKTCRSVCGASRVFYEKNFSTQNLVNRPSCCSLRTRLALTRCCWLRKTYSLCTYVYHYRQSTRYISSSSFLHRLQSLCPTFLWSTNFLLPMIIHLYIISGDLFELILFKRTFHAVLY